MLRQGTSSVVDLDRYLRVFKAVIDDLEPVLTKATQRASTQFPNTETGYRDYINISDDLPKAYLWARRTKSLITEMSQRKGYQICFRRLGDDSKVYDLGGFVSWLFLNDGTKTLTVIYNTSFVTTYLKLDPNDEGNLKIHADNIIAKVFLHEFAHASLHLNKIRERITTSTPRPKLDADHEQDAWAYAEAAWGVLIGDHSHCLRTAGNCVDESWKQS
jgi:hypothetical protein